ncbi:MAG: tripartite tricarboxylate transporter substrate binding protein [Ideonella sp.]|nr:tripartite tricarboxylate transporter substrate binding protein [Ideonella sp.]MCC7459237.1 tripartite tricarboxylate transporter substrate binding protein [Nitrospira sp.]
MREPPPCQQRRQLLAVVASLPLAHAGVAWAQEYPSKPVTFIVSFPPGSGADTTARLYTRRMQDLTRQTFIVENRPGANSFLAAQAVARANPDGYTLFYASNSPVAVNAVLFKKPPYDPVADFAPVARASRATNLVVVSASSPYKTVAELLAAAKKQPKALSYASGSASYQIATELFAEMAGVELLHVPYKGAAPALVDTAAGVVQFAIADISAALPLIHGHRLRALAVTSDKRHTALPEVPTAAEAGVKGYEFYNWTGLFAPAKTPPAVIDKLAKLMQQITAEPETAAFLTKLGGEIYPGGPQKFRRYQLAEIEQWRRAAKRAGIEPE